MIFLKLFANRCIHRHNVLYKDNLLISQILFSLMEKVIGKLKYRIRFLFLKNIELTVKM